MHIHTYIHTLLIKIKKMNDEGDYLTILVVPATNFVSCFTNGCYHGILEILKRYKLVYGQKTIVQASDLKEILESNKDITRDNIATFLSISTQCIPL